ncbi:MAG: hypothetical protein DWQ07_22655 [Chloroflexi bacterium]|nr:MAG: hypothetical protein DWQ07_22655 [Chloroflexota bacterium]MBL1193950.1 hypothetical protein [Chloroflexota bacterium]
MVHHRNHSQISLLLIFRATLWTAIPIYVHLHWNFPRPLFSLPKRFWLVTYFGFVLIAISQFLIVLPESVHLTAFFIAVLASILLAVMHYILRPAERRAIRVLLWAILFSFVPLLAVTLTTVFNTTTGVIAGALLALPIMPFAYFYAIFRHRLGGLELRANRIISVYLFIFLAATIISFITPLLLAWVDFPGSSTTIAVSVAVLTVIFAVSGFRRFERFVEERVLGIPLPPEGLMHSYAREITGSLNLTRLNQVLSETILPSMLIRQSCLLFLDKEGSWSRILSIGVQDNRKVQRSQIPALLEQTSKYLPIHSENGTESALDWVRLIIPLDIEGEIIGLWLFGRRDPEDFYSQRDIAFLQTLANQTSVAVSNISLATDLRSLYMANVKRQEDEKEHIARELHDDVLNELAVLSMKMSGNVSSEFQKDYQKLTDHIRGTVQDLRPPMLNHGLHTAFEELGQTLNKRTNHGTEIEVTIPPSPHRFDERVEAHLFRIVQQACENAIRHADAQTIFVSGTIESEAIQLEVIDNGAGFNFEAGLDLAGLLAEKHYGIASMMERAELLGAELKIDSGPGSGTTVAVHWTPG